MYSNNSFSTLKCYIKTVTGVKVIHYFNILCFMMWLLILLILGHLSDAVKLDLEETQCGENAETMPGLKSLNVSQSVSNVSRVAIKNMFF